MLNFEFWNGTKLYFGKGTEARAGELVKNYASKALVCCYGTKSTIGVVENTLKQLEENGVEYKTLSGIKPNPELAKVNEGIDLVRDNDLGFILAIGGGSVVDTAKAIAAGVYYEGDVWDLYAKKAGFEKALPTGVLLSFPAAGSESSNGSVITNEETHQKLAIVDDCLRPAFAILNPELTFTLPAYQTFCGVVDIMSHVMERYFSSTTYTDLTDKLCEAVLRSVIKNALLLLDSPADYNARAEIMLASTIAHNDLLGVGRTQDWGSHNIGMVISGIYGSTHGATLSVITPAWAKYIYKHNVDRFAQFAVRVFDIEYDFMDPENTAMEGIIALEAFFKRIGIPTELEELGITDDSRFDEMADLYELGGFAGDIVQIKKDDFVNILKLARKDG